MVKHDAAASSTEQIKARDEQLKAQAEGKEMVEKLYWPLLDNNATIKKLAEEAL